MVQRLRGTADPTGKIQEPLPVPRMEARSPPTRPHLVCRGHHDSLVANQYRKHKTTSDLETRFQDRCAFRVTSGETGHHSASISRKRRRRPTVFEEGG
jgi:hypothetical protein